MSSNYHRDRQAMLARLMESRIRAPPTNLTLTRMMPGCKDDNFRRIMERAFEGPRSLRTKTICDLASELPWTPSQELSSPDGVVSKGLMGVAIVAGLGLACYAVRKHCQVRHIAGEKRKRETDEEAKIGISGAVRNEPQSGKRQRTSTKGQTHATPPRALPQPAPAPVPAPTPQVLSTKPVSLSKAPSAKATAEMTPTATSSQDIPPPAPAPASQVLPKKPVSLPKAPPPMSAEEMTPFEYTVPPWPGVLASPPLTLATLTAIQEVFDIGPTDAKDDDDGAQSAAAGSVPKEPVDGDDRGDDENTKDMGEMGEVSEDGETEDEEADSAQSGEEDSSDDDD